VTAPPPDLGLPQIMEVVRTLRLDLLVKLGLAVLLGGIIGFEREVAGKPAGLRTNILICVGAALLMELSINLAVNTNGATPGTDPTRIAAQIVSGVGFLGAGTIMHSQGMVTGLTSAATIWVVAAIGMTIGAGEYIEGIGAGLLVTFVLAGLGSLEHWLRRARRVASGTIRARVGTPVEDVRTALQAHGINIESQRVFDHPEDRTFELKLSGPARQFTVATTALMARDYIYGVHID
jgi:putative Mg2+ transporter-C (MgtC) family protein